MSSSFSYLRSIDDQDLDWVLEIESKAYLYPWSRRGFELALEQGLGYIFCSAEGESLGYACLQTVLDEAHLLNFCVAPYAQNQGVGQQAFQALQDKLVESDFTVMMLEVRVSNKPALKLYEKLGFQMDGVRKEYYRSRVWDEVSQQDVEFREDAVLMSLPFKQA